MPYPDGKGERFDVRMYCPSCSRLLKPTIPGKTAHCRRCDRDVEIPKWRGAPQCWYCRSRESTTSHTCEIRQMIDATRSTVTHQIIPIPIPVCDTCCEAHQLATFFGSKTGDSFAGVCVAIAMVGGLLFGPLLFLIAIVNVVTQGLAGNWLANVIAAAIGLLLIVVAVLVYYQAYRPRSMRMKELRRGILDADDVLTHPHVVELLLKQTCFLGSSSQDSKYVKLASRNSVTANLQER